jgi:uncharacterized protein YdeI (YjbR/CyaY-like superfamily)
MIQPTFFEQPSAFRKWLAQNHATQKELWVGYYKKHTKKLTMTWSESVDQALCYGWIDGIRKKIDEEAYMIRFTPRKPTSFWSAVNIKKIEELTQKGLMQPSGIAAWERRKDSKSKVYSYEQDKISILKPEYLNQIKANKKAFTFFENLAPGYKKHTIWWVMSAKREATQIKRLTILIESAEQGLKIPHLRKK